jgi:hypothetical protein
MTNFLLTLRCLVDGDPNSKSFRLTSPFTDFVEPRTVEDLRTIIYSARKDWFNGVYPEDLTLWYVSIPDDGDEKVPIPLEDVPEKRKLEKKTILSNVFGTELPEDTIHIIVQRPLQGNADLLFSDCSCRGHYLTTNRCIYSALSSFVGDSISRKRTAAEGEDSFGCLATYRHFC